GVPQGCEVLKHGQPAGVGKNDARHMKREFSADVVIPLEQCVDFAFRYVRAPCFVAAEVLEKDAYDERKRGQVEAGRRGDFLYVCIEEGLLSYLYLCHGEACRRGIVFQGYDYCLLLSTVCLDRVIGRLA